MSDNGSSDGTWSGTATIIAAVITGIATLVAALIATGTFQTGATPATTPSVTATQSPSPSTTQRPSPSPDPTVTNVGPALLRRALLSSQTLGRGTRVDKIGTDVSQLAGICGVAPPAGIRSTAYEELNSAQEGNILTESIVKWDSPRHASQAIQNERTALGQTGCRYSDKETTEQFSSASSGSPPQGCGQYLVEQTSINSGEYGGYRVEAACGAFTIVIENLTTVPLIDGRATADGYLDNADGRLMSIVS